MHDDATSQRVVRQAVDRGIVRTAWQASFFGLMTVVVFGAFVNALKFAMPLYTMQVLDRVPASGSAVVLAKLTAIALAAVVTGVSLEAVRRRMMTRWGAWLELRFGRALMGDSFAFGGSRGQQSLADLSSLRKFISRSASAWLDLIWAPAFVIAVFYIDPLLGAILSAATALMLLLGALQDRMTRAPRRTMGEARDAGKEIVSLAEKHHDTVRAHGMAGNLSRVWSDSHSFGLEEMDRMESRTALFATLHQGLYRCLYVGGMCAGVWLVLDGSLTIGGVIAANLMMRFGFRMVARPALRWRSLVNARRAYRRIAARLMSDQSAVPVSATENSASKGLDVENVSYRYPGTPASVFRRIAITVAPGNMLCVIGPSGSGKSTLSRLLVGALRPRTGHIRLGDVDVSRLASQQALKRIGYMSQDIQLFPGTIRTNIAHAAAGELADVVEAAKLANIHETIVGLPAGYDTEIDDDSRFLSTSERRRIALARALYGMPELLVLDEPAAHLDRNSRKALMVAMQAIKDRGGIVVATTHSTGLGKEADQVLLLSRRKGAIETNPVQTEAGKSHD